MADLKPVDLEDIHGRPLALDPRFPPSEASQGDLGRNTLFLSPRRMKLDGNI